MPGFLLFKTGFLTYMGQLNTFIFRQRMEVCNKQHVALLANETENMNLLEGGIPFLNMFLL